MYNYISPKRRLRPPAPKKSLLFAFVICCCVFPADDLFVEHQHESGSGTTGAAAGPLRIAMRTAGTIYRGTKTPKKRVPCMVPRPHGTARRIHKRAANRTGDRTSSRSAICRAR